MSDIGVKQCLWLAAGGCGNLRITGMGGWPCCWHLPMLSLASIFKTSTTRHGEHLIDIAVNDVTLAMIKPIWPVVHMPYIDMSSIITSGAACDCSTYRGIIQGRIPANKSSCSWSGLISGSLLLPGGHGGLQLFGRPSFWLELARKCTTMWPLGERPRAPASHLKRCVAPHFSAAAAKLATAHHNRQSSGLPLLHMLHCPRLLDLLSSSKEGSRSNHLFEGYLFESCALLERKIW